MNYYPPPNWWGYGGPPQNNQNGNNRGHGRGNQQKVIERAVRNALRMRDQPKIDKRKKREEAHKAGVKRRAEMLYFLEIFILGIVSAPFVGMGYNYLKGKYGLP